MGDYEFSRQIGNRLLKGFTAVFALLAVESICWVQTTENYDRYDAEELLHESGVRYLKFEGESPVAFGIGICGINENAVFDFEIVSPGGVLQDAWVCKGVLDEPRIVWGPEKHRIGTTG